MAWQKTVGIGAYGSRLRVTVDLLSQNKSTNRSYIRVRIEAYNGGSSRTYNVGSGADWALSGTVSASGSQTFSIPGRSWYTFVDQNFTVNHDSAGNLSLSITGRLSNTGTTSLGNGGSATVTASLPRLVLAPTAPSWGSTSYSAPGSIRVTWTNRATARGPYTSLEIQRWRASLGKWYALGTLSGTATSYTDSSLPANEEVRYRVRAKGPGGTSSWATGGTMGTVPAAPSNVVARKSGLSIVVSWTDNAAMQGRTRTFLVEDRPGGGSWVQVGSIGGSATSWTHGDADPAVTHQYRVRARTTSGGLDHTSPYSTASAVVQLQAPPKQPSRIGPKDAVPLVIGSPVTFVWTHNPVDTTDQTAAEVQWRVDGGAWTTVPVTGSASSVTATPVTGSATRARLEWRVRTRGDHPDWSPWSTINGPVLSTVPVVTLQTPVDHEPFVTSRVDASWVYEPGGAEAQLAQSEFVVELLRGGDVVESVSGRTAVEASLGSRLENETEYSVRVRARNGDALWSEWGESTFTTDFPLPYPVRVFPVWDRSDASVSIEFELQEVVGYVGVDAIDVERRDDGGDWVLIASGIEVSTSITDRTPRIGDVEYRAVSRTVLPTETIGPVVVASWPFPVEGAYVSGGIGFGLTCTGAGASATDTPGIEQSTKRLAGVRKPVAFFGTGRTHALTFTGVIPLSPNETTVSTREEWEALLHEYGVVCYRDPVGRKRFGLLTLGFSQDGPIESVTVDVEEVEWSESVRRVTDLELEEAL